MLENLLLVFIPVFVVMDPIGILPIFVSLTDGLDKSVKRKIVIHSLVTALVLAVTFIFIGKAIFNMLGITVADFMIAGGVILFCIAIIDLLLPVKLQREGSHEIGAVPIGTPLIVGPGVLTAALILVDHYGIVLTLWSVFINILIVGMVFLFSGSLMRLIGKSGSRALSKVMALLLAAIAVKMIRSGLQIIAGI